MPAKGKGQYQRVGKQNLRERFRDYNSQRRYRGQRTISWDAYQRRTRGGKVKFTSKKK